ncbi:unnamed protein product, partial [marine sediment metagenome]
MERDTEVPFLERLMMASEIYNKLREHLAEWERGFILEALETCKWDKKKTAKVLDIGLSSLYRKMLILKIRKPRTITLGTSIGTFKFETNYQDTIEVGTLLYLCENGKVSPEG